MLSRTRCTATLLKSLVGGVATGGAAAAAKTKVSRVRTLAAATTRASPLPQQQARVVRSNKSLRYYSTTMISDQELKDICSKQPDHDVTKSYKLQHTMYRVKDPKVSLDFYTRVLGMKYLHKIDNEDNKFTLYFVGYEKPEDIPQDHTERKNWTFTRQFIVELVHNWGTEDDPNFKYHNGNDEHKGFGHIAITVPDTQAATERLEKLDVRFIKKPNEGKMKGIVFIKDPDGYWIELIDAKCISGLP